MKKEHNSAKKGIQSVASHGLSSLFQERRPLVEHEGSSDCNDWLFGGTFKSSVLMSLLIKAGFSSQGTVLCTS